MEAETYITETDGAHTQKRIFYLSTSKLNTVISFASILMIINPSSRRGRNTLHFTHDSTAGKSYVIRATQLL
jgi:hypothetical protein